MSRDPRVDDYIANAPAFAQPLLAHLRALVHRACPDVEETIKWRMPAFTYHGLLCSMAAFKQHAAFGLWKAKLVLGADAADDAMGQFGRLTARKDLPADTVLLGYIRKAAELNAAGVAAPRARKAPRPPPALPDDLAAALKKNRKAAATYAAFSPSCQREYVEWILEAKRAPTRAQRVATAVEWMAEGKQRNWKYQNC